MTCRSFSSKFEARLKKAQAPHKFLREKRYANKAPLIHDLDRFSLTRDLTSSSKWRLQKLSEFPIHSRMQQLHVGPRLSKQCCGILQCKPRKRWRWTSDVQALRSHLVFAKTVRNAQRHSARNSVGTGGKDGFNGMFLWECNLLVSNHALKGCSCHMKNTSTARSTGMWVPGKFFRISEVPITTYHNNCLRRQLWEQFYELPNHQIKILTYRWASELSMTRSKVGDPEKPLKNSLLMNISFTKKGVPWRLRFVQPSHNMRQIHTLFIRAYDSWIIMNEWMNQKHHTVAYIYMHIEISDDKSFGLFQLWHNMAPNPLHGASRMAQTSQHSQFFTLEIWT